MEIATQIACYLLIASNLLLMLGFLAYRFCQDKELKKDLADWKAQLARQKEFDRKYDQRIKSYVEQTYQTMAASNSTPQ